MIPHDNFIEMCAVSIAGELTAAERVMLEAHLHVCAACRQALEQFKVCPKVSIPAAADEFSHHTVEFDPSVSVEGAEARFFARFDEEGGFGTSPSKNVPRE